MIQEIATLYIKPGMASKFETDFAIGGQYISSIKGYIGHKLQKCLEKQDKYILLVEWETLDDHIKGFRDSEIYLKWKDLLHHYYDPFPTVEHFKTIIENTRL